MMYIDAFKQERQLISQYGENKAFIVWTMGLYLNCTDLMQLANDYLTDCGDDKKIDFLLFDQEQGALYIVQGYYSMKDKDNAPANKASDLNCAVAWLTNGDISKLPKQLNILVQDVRNSLANGDVNTIDLIYLHNCSESKEVMIELETVAGLLTSVLNNPSIDIRYKEMGSNTLNRLFMNQAANIVVVDKVQCPFVVQFCEYGTGWKSAVMTVNGQWLRALCTQFAGDLYSANYRGYLGLGRKKINIGIKNTAEKEQDRFWAYNNGITILTNHFEEKNGVTELDGISIINGAQTTGSLGCLPSAIDLQNVKILTRIIESDDPKLVSEIVKYNNTQNRITPWDGFSNDSMQQEIQRQFADLGHTYNIKRGFESHSSALSVENSVQPILAFNGKYKDANRSKTAVFESRTLYSEAFELTKARHILFVSCLNACISNIKAINKHKVLFSGEAISDNDKKIYEMLAPIKIKFYILAIIGDLLPKLFNNLSDKSKISLMPEFAKAELHSFDDIVVRLTPFVQFVVSQIATCKALDNFMATYQDSNSSVLIATEVEGKIAGMRSVSPPIEDMLTRLSQMICNG